MGALNYLVDNLGKVFELFVQHLEISFMATFIAAAFSIPLGVVIHRVAAVRPPVLGLVYVVQTIPNIAILGLVMPVLGVGYVPAVFAISLNAVLPILMNTYSGLSSVQKSTVEAARGMGMTNWQILLRVETPLALHVIVAGLRTGLLFAIGVTTIAAYIGAGGLGELIFQGIVMVDTNMLLAGALPVTLLAIVADALMGILQRQLKNRAGRRRSAAPQIALNANAQGVAS